jgi:hypothetical protein
LCSEEANFSIAYSVPVYNDAEMFERLLRAIYRPQNVYCVHVDLSAQKILHSVIRAIVNCFSNVFISPKQVDVVYREFSVLEADLLCMQALLAFSKIWKYFINLTGQEFPLKSNLAIVRILKILNGANNIMGTVKRKENYRFDKAGPLPVNVTLTKGSVHIVASRAYVDYVINNDTAKQFLQWTRRTWIPDETYFSSLNHSPQLKVPGSYLGEPETFTGNNLFIARYKNWIGNGPDSYPCSGKWANQICIFGVGDLPRLAVRPELFANKFHVDHETQTYDCLEELLYNRTRRELDRLDELDVAFYSKLSYVNNHL